MSGVLTKNDSYSALWAEFEKTTGTDLPDWLRSRKSEAYARFQELGFPTGRVEEWRFTDIRPAVEKPYHLANGGSPVSPADVKAAFLPGVEGSRIVFINGRYSEELSERASLTGEVVVSDLASALQTHGDLIERHLGKLIDTEKDTFGALNTALFRDGLFLYVPEGVQLDSVIQVVSITAPSGEPSLANTRNLFLFGAGSRACIVESHIPLSAQGETAYLNNIVTEAYTGKNAFVDHYKLQHESEAGFHISTLRVYEEEGAHFRSHCFDFGGSIVRNNLFGKLDGENSEATFNGLYMLKDRQHVDNFMWVEHCKENIPSHELYKGILDDEASAVFTGRIYVHPEAQKTDAKQTNNNLLLTDTARANTKPQLEIYADDVKCTHGATIGQLDDTAMFYLQSRGIPKAQARKLLIHAFASDVTDRVNIEPFREKIQEILSSRLPG